MDGKFVDYKRKFTVIFTPFRHVKNILGVLICVLRFSLHVTLINEITRESHLPSSKSVVMVFFFLAFKHMIENAPNL